MENWFRDHPEMRSIRATICDLNGQARGKRLPAHMAEKLRAEGARMPLSVLNVDIWGDDIEDSPLVFASGDADGNLRPTERGFVQMPWLDTPTAMLPMAMYLEDGTAFAGDPRHALGAVLERYAARGWTPVVATELEFYLIDDSGPTLRPPPSPRSGKRRLGGETLSLRALDAFDAFFTELYEACALMDIPAEAAISESGMGQFEVNLSHSADAMKAADDAWFFKQLTRGLARKHGFAASFMAKPYVDHAGNGLHTHFSVLDTVGANIFDDGGPNGTALLQHAVAGCLAAMPASTLIFAPHGNSYARFAAGSHAPTGIGWGYENRTAAIRIPAGPAQARRIEHRVAGGDINPYLMLAVVLGAALLGIEDRLTPPAPIMGSAYDAELARLPTSWAGAMAVFETDPLTPRLLPKQLIRNVLMTKRQEAQYYAELNEAEQIDLYLDTV
jgi:glutamine synthetase